MKVYVVGIGPGEYKKMTIEVAELLRECDVIAGYKTYISLIKEHFPEKEFLETPMKGEVQRCHLAFKEAQKGKKVVMISSGDAGIYGMAGIMYEIAKEYEGIEVEVLAGVTAACSGASLLGAPLIHDFTVISLSDLLTPWEKIERRLRMAAQGDFCIVLYNPSSKKRKDYLKRACEILMEYLPKDRICGFVKNIGREGTEVRICSLIELANQEVDMFTTVYIGNEQTRCIDGKMVTPRGYL